MEELALLQRENKLMTSAWYDLASRMQMNTIQVSRRVEPVSWLNKQRQAVHSGPIVCASTNHSHSFQDPNNPTEKIISFLTYLVLSFPFPPAVLIFAHFGHPPSLPTFYICLFLFWYPSRDYTGRNCLLCIMIHDSDGRLWRNLGSNKY